MNSTPNEIYAVTDNLNGSFTLAIDGVDNLIQKAQVDFVSHSDESVQIVMEDGKVWQIWNWENEQNLGATSAQNLAQLISDIVNNNVVSLTIVKDVTNTTGFTVGYFLKVNTDGTVGEQDPSSLISSGTYTPTLTNVTNISGSTAYACQWTRVGNVVTVSGRVDIKPTLAIGTASRLGMSLPIASDFAAENQLGGTAASDALASLTARAKADITNNRADFVFKSISTSSDAYSFVFQYIIL